MAKKSHYKFSDPALSMGDIQTKMVKLHNRRIMLTKISNPNSPRQYAWHLGFLNFDPKHPEFEGKRMRDCVRMTELVVSKAGLAAVKRLISAFEKEGL